MSTNRENGVEFVSGRDFAGIGDLYVASHSGDRTPPKKGMTDVARAIDIRNCRQARMRFRDVLRRSLWEPSV